VTFKHLTFTLKILVFIAISILVGSHKSVTTSNENVEVQFIENASMEKVNPDKWLNNSWGENDAKFTFLDKGYLSKHSVKTEITDYKSGDAKWFFEPVELTPGDYTFINYYKSNVDTRVTLAITTTRGKTRYIDLPNAPSSEEWVKYETSFAMPKYGKTATVYHLLTQEGYLVTDAYKIKPYEYVGFNQGLVTITFDDGWEENTKTALPIMKKFSFKSNQFYATSYIENPRVANPKRLINLFIEDGHEIGSHSVTHPYLTELPKEDVTFELEESKTFLQNYLDIDIQYFATPFGAYNTSVKDEIMKYYNAHRTAVDFGYNSKDNFDVSRLKCQSVLSTTTPEEIKKWVDKANDENLWLILLYHRVADNPNEYDTTIEMFREHMQIINDSEISVVTISEALDEISEQ